MENLADHILGFQKIMALNRDDLSKSVRGVSKFSDAVIREVVQVLHLRSAKEIIVFRRKMTYQSDRGRRLCCWPPMEDDDDGKHLCSSLTEAAFVLG